MRSSNMENSNSREYLDKITSAVIDHLRQTGPAPSVQMQDVPRKPFGGMTDEEEAELNDLDEDENKDTRMTELQWDKQVENPAEFEPSEDDDLAKANGATRQNGNKRSFTDHQHDDSEDADGKRTRNSNGAQKEVQDPAADEAHDPNDDTIEDVATSEKNEPEPAAEKSGPEETTETEKTAVDDDGDVGMADSAAAEDTTKIKKEDAEPESVTEAPAPEPENEDRPAQEEASTAAPEASNQADAETSEKADKPTESVEDKAEDKEDNTADAMDVDTEKEKPSEEKVDEKKETTEG